MNKALCEAKLNMIKPQIVPSLFTDKQFDVLIKRIEEKQLSQTEKNYLSRAIKSKLRAAAAIKHIGIDDIYRHEENKKRAFDDIISSYKKSGIDLIGYKPSKGRNIPPTKIVEMIIDDYQEIDERTADLLPVYLSKNKEKIDLFEIYSFAIERGIINFTGYIFEIAHSLSHHEGFKKLIDSLDKIKDKINILRDRRYKKIINLIKQDDISRKWNIYTLNSLDHYKDYFELYGEI